MVLFTALSLKNDRAVTLKNSYFNFFLSHWILWPCFFLLRPSWLIKINYTDFPSMTTATGLATENSGTHIPYCSLTVQRRETLGGRRDLTRSSVCFQLVAIFLLLLGRACRIFPVLLWILTALDKIWAGNQQLLRESTRWSWIKKHREVLGKKFQPSPHKNPFIAQCLWHSPLPNSISSPSPPLLMIMKGISPK